MNSSKLVSCCVEPIDNADLMETVQLEHGKVVNVGRSRMTQVKDVAISRLQVSLTADFNKGEVSVRRIGRQPSYLDSICLEKDVVHTGKNHSILELAENNHRYRIRFQEETQPSNQSSHGNMLESPSKCDYAQKLPNGKERHHCPETFNSELMKPSYCPQLNLLPSTSNDSSMKLINTLVWYETNNSMLVGSYRSAMDKIKTGIFNREVFKVAGFDLDCTLINNQSLRSHSCDWTLWNPSVATQLKKLIEESFSIVIFTNQASLRFQANVPTFKKKMQAIVETLNVPLLVLVATNHDYFRKPAPGMWFYLMDKILEGTPCSMERSFYVGDAAGRIKGWKPGKSKDFSISDRLFARNLKLKFLTPEEHFLNERPARFDEPEFHPWDYPSALPEVENLIGENSLQSKVIVLVGLPASGKTTFAKTHLLPKGYVHVNADIQGSSAKCLKLLSESLCDGKKVVVDNTNLDVAARKKILDICKQMNVSARCLVIDSSFDRCMHNNMFRVLKKTDHAIISPMVMKASRAKFIPPSEVEGFSAIVKAPFIPSFATSEDKTMYNYYLQVTKTK